MVAVARGPAFHRGNAHVEERRGVRGAVAPDRDLLVAAPDHPRDAGAERPDVGVLAIDHHRMPVEGPRGGGAVEGVDVGEDRVGVLAGQVADVHVDHAGVRHAVDGVAARDPAEVDRRPVEEVGRLARERQRLDLAEDVDRLDHRVVPDPRRGAVRGRALDLDPQHEHALGLHADVEVGGLARDREVADVALPHQVGGAALLVRLLRLLVGHAEEVDAHAVLRGHVVQGAHHRREPALHVVGAAPVQAVAVDARGEQLGARGHHVEVAVEDDRGHAGRADRGRQHRAAVVHLAGHLHVAGLEPALDEAGRALHPLEGGRVVGDQALRESAFVHPE